MVARPLELAEVTAAGFLVTGVQESPDPEARLVYEASYAGTPWRLGVGWLADLGAELESYWRDVVDAMEEPAAPDDPERIPGLGEDNIYGSGWLYVKAEGVVFWVFAERAGSEPPSSPRTRDLDLDLARRSTEQFARAVLTRVDTLPPAAPADTTRSDQRELDPDAPTEPVQPLVPELSDQAKIAHPRKGPKLVRKHWERLVPEQKRMGKELVNTYNARGQRHDVLDLATALRMVDEISAVVGATDLDAVRLAVWFHAVVCDPSGEPDLAASAQHAEQSLAATGRPPERIREVRRLLDALAAGAGPGQDPNTLALDSSLPCLLRRQ